MKIEMNDYISFNRDGFGDGFHGYQNGNGKNFIKSEDYEYGDGIGDGECGLNGNGYGTKMWLLKADDSESQYDQEFFRR